MDMVKQHDALVRDVKSAEKRVMDTQRALTSSSKVSLVRCIDCSSISRMSSSIW